MVFGVICHFRFFGPAGALKRAWSTDTNISLGPQNSTKKLTYLVLIIAKKLINRQYYNRAIGIFGGLHCATSTLDNISMTRYVLFLWYRYSFLPQQTPIQFIPADMVHTLRHNLATPTVLINETQ